MVQLSHNRTGWLHFKQLDVDEHPMPGLMLLSAYESNDFRSKIRMYEYCSFDGPVHYFDYAMEPAVELKKHQTGAGLKALIMLEGMLNITADSDEKTFLPAGNLFIFRSQQYMIELQEKACAKYLLFEVGPMAERLDLNALAEGRFNITLAMQAHLAEILRPPGLLEAPGKWLSKRLGKILSQLEEGIEASTPKAQHSKLNLDYAQKAAVFIRQNLNRKLTYDIIARAVGRNPCSLKKEFQTMHSKTMAEYQRHIKMEEAKKHLQYSRTPISEVALECGFEAERTFRDNFFKTTGLCPTEYRKKFGV